MDIGKKDYEVPDLDTRCVISDALFAKDEREVNQEILRRSANALQKAFGKKRDQKTTTVWIMVHCGPPSPDILIMKGKAEVAAHEAKSFIEQYGCSVDTLSSDQAFSEGRRLVFLKLEVTRGRRRVRGIVSKHIQLTKMKKARSVYPIVPRLRKVKVT